MENIIIVFPKLEDGTGIRNILARRGFRVHSVCTQGSQALEMANSLNGGVVICGYRLPDMIYSDLKADLPPNFELLLLASQRVLEECDDGVMSIGMPIKLNDLINTLSMMFENQARARKKAKQAPKTRTEAENKLLDSAKQLLINRNHMSEQEAHRYLQKCSMDSGTNLVEAAQMVLSLYQQ